MKKLFLIVLVIGLFASCQKKSPNAPATTQAVSFGIQQVDPNSLKADGVDPILCNDTIIPDMAWITIDNVDYYAQLTTVDGQLYTQSIQLPPTSETNPNVVTKFVLYKEISGVKGFDDGDLIAFGIPETGSEFAVYVNAPVSFPITVTAFAKAEIPVQVLCFNADKYTEFGYDWFNITQIIVREQCFFGDFCTKHFADYAGSDYANQSTGLALDMPAIFQIKGFVKSGDGAWGPLPGGNEGVFTNDNAAAGWGVGAPVCVQYPDRVGVVDSLRFELYILVKQGGAFNFVLFHTWMFADAEMIPAGNDGVVDFELGNCNVTGADLVLPPYINLPAGAITLTTGGNIPSVSLQPDGTQGYFDVTLAGIGEGYDIANETYAVNCARRTVTISLNTQYTMYVFSSLYPESMLTDYARTIPWNKINWLINHLADYPMRTWGDIQQAIWVIESKSGYDGTSTSNSVPAITAVGLQMVADANLLGGGFVPAPGDLAAIAFEDTTNPTNVQLVIIKLDP
ncbi:MAG: hypothetical protein IH595_11290 [Bacteroidales bacterium]|nr:hypothetical protein [Bacteroidales bacterium]